MLKEVVPPFIIQQLAADSVSQDDWIRINFSLFKLSEILYKRLYEAQQVTLPTLLNDHSLISYVFDLYKVQLYFLMHTGRLIRFIESEAVLDLNQIYFLKELPDMAAQRTDFKCTLSQTLQRMFNSTKVSPLNNSSMRAI